MAKTVYVLNGPNLNLLGTREPHIYGRASLADVEKLCRSTAERHGLTLVFRQSNHEGQIIDWINEARAEGLDVDVPLSALREFAGRFDEYNFSVRENRLYSENSSRNGKTDKLKAITPTLFQIDRESQVEFLRDASGAVTKIRIFWNDGWIDTIARAK